jgi:hypothetical protein
MMEISPQKPSLYVSWGIESVWKIYRKMLHAKMYIYIYIDRLGGLVIIVLAYRPRSSGSDFSRYDISRVVVGIEHGPLSFAKISEELLGRKLASSVHKTEINGHKHHRADHAKFGTKIRW